jgi:hypothetical protein
MPNQAESPSWYHICNGCAAKWFARQRQMKCPRYGLSSISNERLQPPWRRIALANDTPGLCSTIGKASPKVQT